MSNVEYNVSGFAVEGKWEEVVEHGEKVTEALCYLEQDNNSDFNDWDEWRPKIDEDIDEEVCEKTSEQACISEGTAEKKGKTPVDDFQTASERLEKAYETLGQDDTEAIEKAGDTVGYAARAVDTLCRKALRTLEKSVYENVMTVLAPYYFDNDLISANLNKKDGRFRDETVYILEINVNDDTIKQEVKELLERFEEAEHWRDVLQEDEGEIPQTPALPVTEAPTQVPHTAAD